MYDIISNMPSNRYLVIRTDGEVRESIWSHLQEGWLLQGWGVPGSGLLDENGSAFSFETWAANYRIAAEKAWGERDLSDDHCRKRYRILSRMLNLRGGHIVLIPRMPNNECFTICKIAEGEQPYSFDPSPEAERGKLGNDYRHRLGIAPASIKPFGYANSNSGRIVARFMVAYQSAVNNANAAEFQVAVEERLQQQSDCGTQVSHQDLLRDFRREALRDLLKRLRQRTPADLERLVRDIFVNAGYTLLRTNHYDRQGGDADLVLQADLPIVTRYSDRASTIYVQVKLRYPQSGNQIVVDQNDSAAIDQLNLISEDDPSAIKIVAATVDEFTEQCRERARSDGVTLLAGLDLAELLMKYL
ncbi:MAG: restriction endonuclease [Acidobacteriia bacterium]|nr:restriction endonuclease [Terriglobia bacterium]